MARIPEVGTDEFTSDSIAFLDHPMTMVLGGNGAEGAFVLAGLGTRVALCSVIGKDLLGSVVLAWLK